MEKAFDANDYCVPMNRFIPRNAETEKLYDLERNRDDAFMQATKELKEVLGLDHFWQEAVPEAFLNMLQGWDHRAAQLAAVIYLQRENNKAYTEPNKRYLVIPNVNLSLLEEQRRVLSAMQDTNQWENLTPAQCDAVIGIIEMLDYWSDERERG